MSGLREQTAAAIREHQEPEDEGALCGCGFDFSPEDAPSWAEHLASAVVEALGLTEEWGVVEAGSGSTFPDEEADSQEHAEALAAERCQSCDHCRNAFPKSVVSRLVSSWSVVDGDPK